MRSAAKYSALGLFLIVRHVKGLDTVEAGSGEALKDGQCLLRILDVPEGVGPHGDASGAVDQLDRLGGGRRLTLTESRRALNQVRHQ